MSYNEKKIPKHGERPDLLNITWKWIRVEQDGKRRGNESDIILKVKEEDGRYKLLLTGKRRRRVPKERAFAVKLINLLAKSFT